MNKILETISLSLLVIVSSFILYSTGFLIFISTFIFLFSIPGYCICKISQNKEGKRQAKFWLKTGIKVLIFPILFWKQVLY